MTLTCMKKDCLRFKRNGDMFFCYLHRRDFEKYSKETEKQIFTYQTKCEHHITEYESKRFNEFCSQPAEVMI